VDRVRALIPNGWRLYQSRPWAGDLENQPYNCRLPLGELPSGSHDWQIAWSPDWEIQNILKGGKPTTIGNLFDSTNEASILGVTLRDFTRGYRFLDFPDNPISLRLKGTRDARMVAALLRDDVLLAAHRNDPVRGFQVAHAILNAGRSIGDEPTLSSQLIRAVCGRGA
jgi:hypothetical protein